MNKVCIICAMGLPIPATKGGGIETLIQFIIDENEKDHRLDLTLISLDDQEANELRRYYKNTKFITCKKASPWADTIWRFIARFLRKILCFPVGNTLLTNRAFRYIRQNTMAFDLIINEGDLAASEYLFKRPKSAPPLYCHFHTTDRGRWFKRLNRHTGAICCSRHVFDALPKTESQAANSYVLKNQIDPEKFSKVLTQDECDGLRRKLGISKDKYVILYIGRILQVKGVRELIKAVNFLENNNVCLLLVGSSFFADAPTTEYERLVATEIRMGTAQVVQTGFIPNDQLYRYQSISDVQVVPSIWEEAAGLVVLEAQAAGLPIIATRRGGIPEFLGKGAGLLIEAGDKLTSNLTDALRYIIRNPDESSKMRMNGREYVKSIGSKSYFLDFVEIVEKILAKR